MVLRLLKLLSILFSQTFATIGPQGRIFEGNSEPSYFSEPLFYDVRYDLPEDIIRNKRDSRFFPGNQPAGVKGITKELLQFIKDRVNPLGFHVEEEGRPRVEKKVFIVCNEVNTLNHEYF